MARVTEVAKDAVMLTEKRKVTDAKTGEEKHSFSDGPQSEGTAGWYSHCVVDPTGTFLVTTGDRGMSFVRDLASGDIVHALDIHPTHGVAFDDSGQRMAYFIRDRGPDSEAVLCDATDGWKGRARIACMMSSIRHRHQFSHVCCCPSRYQYM